MAARPARAHHGCMKTLIAVVGLVAFVLPAQAAERHAQQGKLSRDARDFLSEAASANMAEQELGRLAETRAQSDRVKDYGRRMVEDHKKAQDQLDSLVREERVTVPEKVSGEHRKTIDRLSKLEGSAFDRAYMDAMREDHTKDVEKFEHASKTIKDAQVKRYAQETLPVLREHLQLARDVSGSLTKATSGAGRGHQP
jgi:putative membrane protein